MALWMVRPGKIGEREQFNLEQSIVSIGWEELPDLRSTAERANLNALMVENYPEKSAATIGNWVGQIWSFAKVIAIGDLVAMPLRSSSSIVFGEVTGDYAFEPAFMAGAEHYCRVNWIKTVPRNVIDQDLLYSFGAIMTVFQIHRNNAEARIRELIAQPSLARKNPARARASENPADSALDDEKAIDLDDLLRDQINKHIARKFDGHGLAELVEAVLQAQGFKTHRSPPGPDGGVDVLAGLGPHGFDGTRLAVQVKSGDIVVDTSSFREFRGVMSNFGARSTASSFPGAAFTITCAGKNKKTSSPCVCGEKASWLMKY